MTRKELNAAWESALAGMAATAATAASTVSSQLNKMRSVQSCLTRLHELACLLPSDYRGYLKNPHLADPTQGKLWPEDIQDD